MSTLDKMIDFIRKYPEMVMDSVQIVRRANIPTEKFDRVIVCGMGASAVGGDILTDIISERGVPISIEVSRKYKLPGHVGKDTLIIFSSYSGETEEILSQFVEARKRGLKMLCVTSGGKLKEWCESLGKPLVLLPPGFKPRATLPYMAFTILEYVAGCGRANLGKDLARRMDFKDDIEESVKLLMSIREDKAVENELTSMAEVMRGSRVCVYGPEDFKAAVVRLKNQINENSKLPSSWGVFPEMDHNDIVGYEDNDLNRGTYIVILRDEHESQEMKVRIDATKEIIKPSARGIIEIWSMGKSKLAKEMYFCWMGDMLSYHLAIFDGKSPDKTDNIDNLKRVLKEKLDLRERLEKELI